MFTCSLQFLLKSKPQASNPSLEAQITASKLKSQHHGSNHSLKHQITVTRLKQVTQGQYVVSDTHCPALSDCGLE